MVTPPNSSAVDVATFYLGWTTPQGDEVSYQLQMDDDDAFASPAVDELLADPIYMPDVPPPLGLYAWRVRSQDSRGNFSPWSQTRWIELLPSPELLSAQSTLRTMQVPTLLQHKDTAMLCLNGDHETDARRRWDASHPDTAGNHATHGSTYCARAGHRHDRQLLRRQSQPGSVELPGVRRWFAVA